jgi:hypothetical protein
MSANKSATGKRSRDCDKSSYTPLKKGKTEVCEPAQSSTFSDLVVGALSFARSLVTSFYPQAQETKTCTCENGDKCAMCIQKNAEKIDVQEHERLEFLQTQTYAKDKVQEYVETEILESNEKGFPFYRISSTTDGVPDDILNCYTMTFEGVTLYFFFDFPDENLKIISFNNPADADKYNFFNSGKAAGYISQDENGNFNVTNKSPLFDIDHRPVH